MATFELKALTDDDIPEGALVNCPLVNSMLRKCKKCLGCEYNQGYIEPNPPVEHDGKIVEAPFHVRYRLVCNHPVTRSITPFAEG